MTSPCTSGVGEPKTGIGPIIVFDAAKLAEFLLQEGMGWLSPYVPQIGGKNYNLDDFCPNYTGPAPTTDPGDIAQFFNPLNPTGAADLLTWLVQVVDQFVWSTSCTCTVGGDPTPPTAIGPPPDVQFQPPDTTPSANCFTGAATARTVNYSNHFAWNFSDVLPAGNGPSDGEFNSRIVPTPVPSSIVLHVTNNNVGIKTYSVQVSVSFQTAQNASITASQYHTADVTVGTDVTTPPIPIPSTAAFWTVIAIPSGGNTGTPTNTVAVESTIYCQGQGPNSLGMVCCPTDPNLLAMLQQILNELTLLETLIPARPPNYAAATSHAGLSGDGTISLAATTIAVRLTFTTTPTYIGSIAGTPTTRLGLGWISPVTNEGGEAGIPVTRSTQVFPLPEATSSLDYTFTPGAVVTIDELLAG